MPDKTETTEKRSKDKALEASFQAASAIKSICLGLESNRSQTDYEKRLKDAREFLSEAGRYVSDAIGELHA